MLFFKVKQKLFISIDETVYYWNETSCKYGFYTPSSNCTKKGWRHHSPNDLLVSPVARICLGSVQKWSNRKHLISRRIYCETIVVHIRYSGRKWCPGIMRIFPRWFCEKFEFKFVFSRGKMSVYRRWGGWEQYCGGWYLSSGILWRFIIMCILDIFILCKYYFLKNNCMI